MQLVCVLLLVPLILIVPCSATIQCVLCGPNTSTKTDCMEHADQVHNCSASTYGCALSHAKMPNDQFYIEKKCYLEKPAKVNACWDSEVTTNTGDKVNGTVCICTTDMCNNGTLHDVQLRLAPPTAATTVKGEIVTSTKSGAQSRTPGASSMVAILLAMIVLAVVGSE